MFDGVSDRYDLLNRVMTLGRDAAWRGAMWNEVPEDAHAVLDLCCGSGASLPGLRRPGRLVLGADVSLRMLERASEAHGRIGWAPRLVCANAFRLPLRQGSLDCVTIAFGARNLRPRVAALSEIARVLRPGGRLVVLEATAPRPGPMAAAHSFYLRRIIPLVGRLSSDPPAYAYLSRSILEFGSGPEFEADLASSDFAVAARRSFMLGATTLWVARRPGADAGKSRAVGEGLHPARLGELPRGEMPNRSLPGAREWRWWAGAKLLLSAAVLASLVYALWLFARSGGDLSWVPWQRGAMRILLVVATVGFVIRTAVLALHFLGPPPRD